MKIYFLRHGEAMDDVENKYGGWGDPKLSPRGRNQAKGSSVKFEDKNIDLVLSSPLKRALETAEIVGKALDVEVEKWLYLKERNTYGLMCGEKKDEMKEKYPKLYNAYENGEWVPGSETWEQTAKRVKLMVEKIQEFEAENVIAVTHSKLLKVFIKEHLNKKMDKKEDCCVLEVEISDGGMKFISADGITFKE